MTQFYNANCQPIKPLRKCYCAVLKYMSCVLLNKLHSCVASWLLNYILFSTVPHIPRAEIRSAWL